MSDSVYRPVVIAVAVVAALGLAFVATVFAADAARDDRIADGMRIGSVDVGGLDAGAAGARVQRALAAALREPVTVRYRDARIVVRPEQLRARVDVDGSVEAARRRGRAETSAFSRVLGGGEVDATVAPKVVYSQPALRELVGRVAKRVGSPPRDADIDVRDGKLSRVHARSGVVVKRDELAAALVSGLTATDRARTVTVPVKVTAPPDRTLDDLARRYPTIVAVDRDAKKLRLYKDLRLARTYVIAVGKAGLETAAGRYKIREKQVDPPWHVPTSSWAGDLAGQTIAPDDPRNPLEARWMGFHDGQGIHGTDDLASLGTAASHGCIRMSVAAVKQLYARVKLGTPLFLQ